MEEVRREVPKPPAAVTSVAIAGVAVPAMGPLIITGNWALGLRCCSFENDILMNVGRSALNITVKGCR